MSGPLWLFWEKVTRGAAGMQFADFTTAVASFAEGTLWRHNQAGDLPGEGDAIDVEALGELVEANRGRRGFTYTHKPMALASNRRAVGEANAAGFTINLSANNVGEVDALVALGIGPVVTVLPEEYGRKAKGDVWLETIEAFRARAADLPKQTAGGIPVAICPATYLDTSCADCQLCQRRNRKCAVGFPAHGTQKKAAAKIAAR